MPTDALPPEIQRELDAIDAALAGDPVAPELTELGQLALALRDERPEIRSEFGHELDRRRAAGFRKPRRESRFGKLLRGSPMLVPGVAASMLLALVVGVALIGSNGIDTAGDDSGGGSTASSADSSAGAGEAAPETDALRQQDSSGGRNSSGGQESSGAVVQRSKTISPSPIPPPAGGGSPRSDRDNARKVERSASMTLVAPPKQLDRAANEIVQTAYRSGGFVVSSSVNTSTDGGGGEFLLRVPTARLDTTLAQLARIADVRETRQATQDITAEHSSARSRLQDARAERKSLLRRLARAVTETEAAAIKAQLRDVGARIAAAKTDLARVNNRATFANVGVTLTSDPDATGVGEESDDGAWSPGDAAKDAVRVLEVAAGVALIALAVAVPLGLLALAAALLVRWSTRRGRERALDAI